MTAPNLIKSAAALMLVVITVNFFSCKKKNVVTDPDDSPSDSSLPSTGARLPPAELIGKMPVIDYSDTMNVPQLNSTNSPEKERYEIQNMPVPGDQFRELSCVAWSVAYASMSYCYRKLENNGSLRLSPGYLWSYNLSRQAWSFEEAFLNAQQFGVSTLAKLPDPLFGSTPSEDERYDALDYTISESIQLARPEKDLIKAMIRRNHPVMFMVKPKKSFLKWTNKNYWRTNPDGSSLYFAENNELFPNHAMTIVGFDDGLNAYKVQNSWISGWDPKGYCWIDYEIVRKITVMEGPLPCMFVILPREINSLAATATATSAKVDAVVLPTLFFHPKVRGIYISEKKMPLAADSIKKEQPGSTGAYTVEFDSLKPNTIYYYRGYASDGITTKYGNKGSFQTKTGDYSWVGTFIGTFKLDSSGEYQPPRYKPPEANPDTSVLPFQLTITSKNGDHVKGYQIWAKYDTFLIDAIVKDSVLISKTDSTFVSASGQEQQHVTTLSTFTMSKDGATVNGQYYHRNEQGDVGFSPNDIQEDWGSFINAKRQ